ncbi:cysteine--tRNA ligase [Candidatus Woesearchaeota archaeon]|nr:cysteine--tRNA ligase [Candidatus Woesearchaeota archaeon]
MAQLTLYNTLSRKKEVFQPLRKNHVGLYTCGPTVYHFAHIGNLRAYIFEDLLKRALLFNGYPVKHVMNITDVGHLSSDADEGEDKMTKGLQREGLPLTLGGMRTLASKYTKAFVADLRKLNIILPDEMPKASKYIQEDVEFILLLQKKNIAYRTSDGIYFDTSKIPDYGKLAGMTSREEEEHARVKLNVEKKNRKDFALWKLNPHLGWSTELGKGFPGWHIECSVMASHHLGKQFDIHCGGREHIPIHHTNEIAQSEAAFNIKPWVRYWLHNEWLILGSGEKMAKSGENFITLSTLEQKGYHPLDYRYFCLGAHYRHPLVFSYEALDAAKTARKRLNDKVLELRKTKGTASATRQKKYLDQFTSQMNDDLNTPQAVGTLWDMIKDTTLSARDKYILLLKFDTVLGLDFKKVREEKIPKDVLALAEERLSARRNKEWKKSDELREKIRRLGYSIGDTAEGYELKKE